MWDSLGFSFYGWIGERCEKGSCVVVGELDMLDVKKSQRKVAPYRETFINDGCS